MARENITVLSYNVACALSDGRKAPAVLEQISIHEPTVAVFPEAYRTGDSGIEEYVFDDLDKMGYKQVNIDQEFIDDRPDARGILVVAKEQTNPDFKLVALSARMAIMARLYDPASDEPINFFGYHGNDKNEALRVADTEVLIDRWLPLADATEEGGRYIARPTLHAGDHNTMKPNGFLPWLLRSSRPLVDALPSVAPNPDEKQARLKRNASTAQRLSQMAIGTPLAMLADVGLEDVDKTNEPTMRKSGIAVKIDHVLASTHFESVAHRVVRGLTVDGDVRGEPLSDHDLLLEVVRLAQPNR